MGKSIQGGRTDFGTVPGDGGTVFVPLHMSPCLAKEYLWLAREMTGKELAAARIINAAVPARKLDATVDAMAKALLERTPYSLALAKRAANKMPRGALQPHLRSRLELRAAQFLPARPACGRARRDQLVSAPSASFGKYRSLFGQPYPRSQAVRETISFQGGPS